MTAEYQDRCGLLKVPEHYLVQAFRQLFGIYHISMQYNEYIIVLRSYLTNYDFRVKYCWYWHCFGFQMCCFQSNWLPMFENPKENWVDLFLFELLIHCNCWHIAVSRATFNYPHPHPHPPDKIAAISQTTCSNAFSWMKIFEVQIKYHWNMFLGV